MCSSPGPRIPIVSPFDVSDDPVLISTTPREPSEDPIPTLPLDTAALLASVRLPVEVNPTFIPVVIQLPPATSTEDSPSIPIRVKPLLRVPAGPISRAPWLR